MILRSCASPRFSLAALCLLVVTVWATSAQAQTFSKEKGQGCADDIVGIGDPGYQGHKILSVQVKARFFSIPLPPPGTPYSPVVVSKLVEDVSQALKNERNRESIEGATEFKLLNAVSVGRGELEDSPGSGPAIRFSAVTSCVKLVEPEKCKSALGQSNPNCVDVTIRAITLRLDADNIWANFLPLTRSNKPTFFSQVPGPLLAFNPKVGVDHDRRFGVSETVELSTNLLDLPRTLRSQPVTVSKTRLDLKAQGRKSQSDPFYNTNTHIAWSHRLSKLFESIAVETGFIADHLPLADGNYLRNALAAGASLKLQPNVGILTDLTIGGRYLWSNNRFSFGDGAGSERASQNAFEGRIISDGHLGDAVTRLALWADVGSPNSGRNTYHRLAGLFGYQKEFPVAINQTIGVEVILGAGRAWGEVPQYARFYGGNTQKNFLYEPSDSPVMTSFPAGPLLRSFGSGQATAGATASMPNGGTSYWHVNLNVTIPIPAWSSPLVPNIEIDGIPKRDQNGKVVLDENGEPVIESRPLKTVLKNQGESSKKVLKGIFVRQGSTPQEAQVKAERELKGINSLINFIADQANLYSVKPLIMFDSARVSAPGDEGNRTRFAFGGGIQFTIVVAKFEAGYMQTINRAQGDSRGNFVMRLVFQNLF